MRSQRRSGKEPSGKEPRKGRKPEGYNDPPDLRKSREDGMRVHSITSFRNQDDTWGTRIMIRDNTSDSVWLPLQARRAAREGVLMFTGETRLTSQTADGLRNYSDAEIEIFISDRGQSLIQHSPATGESGFGELIAYPKEDVPEYLHATMPNEPARIVVDRCRVDSAQSHIVVRDTAQSAPEQFSASGQAPNTHYAESSAGPSVPVFANDNRVTTYAPPTHQATASAGPSYDVEVPGGWIPDPAVDNGTSREDSGQTEYGAGPSGTQLRKSEDYTVDSDGGTRRRAHINRYGVTKYKDKKTQSKASKAFNVLKNAWKDKGGRKDRDDRGSRV